MPVNQFKRLGTGGVFVHGNDFRHHEVAHPGADVAEVDRQRLVEALQDSVDPGVGIPAAGGSIAQFTALLLEGGVSDG